MHLSYPVTFNPICRPREDRFKVTPTVVDPVALVLARYLGMAPEVIMFCSLATVHDRL
jgi:hypothetical protein